MIRLIVNADDLGLHPRIDEGIFDAFQRGLVTSATVLVTGRNAAQAIQRANELKLPLGLHLALTTHLSPAAPISDVRWLAPGGRLRRDWGELSAAWLSRLIPSDEVALELRAQLALARSMGAKIDHLDTHQHFVLLPGLTQLVEQLAVEEGLPLRWPSEPMHRQWLVHPRSALKTGLLKALGAAKAPSAAKRVGTVGIFEAGRLNERRLVRLISNLKPGVWDLACHPGLSPGTVPEDPTWRYNWEEELSALTSSAARAATQAHGVELTNYGAL